MLGQVRQIGNWGLNYCANLGKATIFLSHVLLRNPRFLRFFPLLIDELCVIGVLSLSIIVVSALFIGMVVALQGYNTLKDFGATQQLGPLLALTVTRELGPVVTGLLFAGRAGSALTAEIGLMKTTEQIDSMKMMGVDPLWRVIYPRFWAGFISMPILTVIFNVIAVLGGYIVGVEWLGVGFGSFWNNMQSNVDFRVDVMGGLVKSLVFGFVVTWIALFEGYNSVPTATGISRATTRSVVYSSLAVLGLDFVLTTFMIGEW